MMKKQVTVLLAALLLMMTTLPAFAAQAKQRVYDQAALFTGDECEQLEEKLEAASDEMGMDFILVTTNSKDGKELRAYADAFYGSGEFGTGDDRSGILFLIDMEDRVTYIVTHGQAVSYFDDARIAALTDGNDTLIQYLGEAKYYDGAADTVDQAVAFYRLGKPENAHTVAETTEKKKGLTLIEVLIAVLLPGLAGLIYVANTKKAYAMEAEKQNSTASLLSYQATAAFAYSLANDKLLDKKVTTRIVAAEGGEKSKEGQSTVHKAEDGNVYGGGGGKRKF